MDFNELKGQTITSIEGDKGSCELAFTMDNKNRYVMYHSQD
jgi:hypothetical protein